MLFPYQEGGPRAGPGGPGQEAAMERMEQIAFLNHILLEEMPQYREEAARYWGLSSSRMWKKCPSIGRRPPASPGMPPPSGGCSGDL